MDVRTRLETAVRGSASAVARAYPAPRTADRSTAYTLLVSCILGSRVRFEVAQAYTEAIRSRVIDDPGILSAPLPQLQDRVSLVLSAPTQVNKKPVSRYPFAKSRAGWVTRSLVQIRTFRWGALLNQFRSSPVDARRRIVSAYPGLGPKQASLFLRSVGASDQMAVLDVHLIRFMAIVEDGTWKAVRPGGLPAYERLETAFLRYSKKMAITPTILDLTIWFVMREAQRMAII